MGLYISDWSNPNIHLLVKSVNWSISDTNLNLSVTLLVLQEIHQCACIHSNHQVLHSICALENHGNKSKRETLESAESYSTEWKLGLLKWNRTPPCVSGSACGLWTPSAESSAWGQSSPRTPLDNAGRNLGMTILHTVIGRHYNREAVQSHFQGKICAAQSFECVCTCVRGIIFVLQLKCHQQFENSSAKRKDTEPWRTRAVH